MIVRIICAKSVNKNVEKKQNKKSKDTTKEKKLNKNNADDNLTNSKKYLKESLKSK